MIPLLVSFEDWGRASSSMSYFLFIRIMNNVIFLSLFLSLEVFERDPLLEDESIAITMNADGFFKNEAPFYFKLLRNI